MQFHSSGSSASGDQFGFLLAGSSDRGKAWLPDFLADHSLLATEQEMRLKEFWQRWSEIVASLWYPDLDVVYALRFDWQPLKQDDGTPGQLQIALMSQVRGATGGAGLLREELAMSLRRTGLSPVDVTSGDMAPLQGPFCYEISQKEARTPIREDTSLSQTQKECFSIPDAFLYPDARSEPLHGEGRQPGRGQDTTSSGSPRFANRTLYEVIPWWGCGGPYLSPFQTLAATDRKTSLIVLLRPTLLSPGEQTWLAEAASGAESMGQRSIQSGNSIRAGQTATDPQLRWASRQYAANLRRLTNPFLAAAYCISEDESCARHLANSVAQVINEERSFGPPLGESETMPSGASYSRQPPHVLQMCQTLSFDCDFLASDAPGERFKRLKYLCDARGAAMVFRLPVSTTGGIPGIPVRQVAPSVHPGPIRPDVAAAGSSATHETGLLQLGHYEYGGAATIAIKDLTKHALVTGFTGSGKTTTVLTLLHNLWVASGIPFLVVESAKKEYRGFLGIDAFKNGRRGDRSDRALVYTLGNETVAPFRLNPFELLPDVRVEAHISRLQACFEGALPALPMLPPLLAQALEKVYKSQGWVLTDSGPDGADPHGRRFPTFDDFIPALERAVVEAGYAGDINANVRAATVLRVKRLMTGSLRFMFGSERSTFTTLQELSAQSQTKEAGFFERPVVLELNDLNLEDKALVMMLLLIFLREYREINKTGGQLCHLTVVEEAHNVLGQVEHKGGESAADTRAKSVEAFCNLLAEVRALGEGIVIADQSPNKLAPDAIRNTNLQIAHQLRDGNDRKAIANAMIMSEDQCEFIGKLDTGHAALFHTGLQRAAFIKAPNYYDSIGKRFARELNDAVVVEHMDSLCGGRQVDVPFKSCEACPVSECCPHRHSSWSLSRKPVTRVLFQRVVEAIKEENTVKVRQKHEARDLGPEREKATKHKWRTAVEFLISATGYPGAEHCAEKWCLYLHARRVAGLPDNLVEEDFKYIASLMMNQPWKQSAASNARTGGG